MDSPSKKILRFGNCAVQTDANGRPIELGRGGMGTTYKAMHLGFKRPVVVKVINDELLATNREGALKRFFNEAHAAALIQHPNVARVLDCSPEDADQCYIAMEFIEGETLKSHVARHGPLNVGEALLLLRGVADALGALEEHRLVHRDIKPENIMLEKVRTGVRARLIDFGIVKALGEANDFHQTVTDGKAPLTPYYASPEQFEPSSDVALDIRSDMYSLGATMWHSLTGFPPFVGTVRVVMFAHVWKDPEWGKLDGVGDKVTELLRLMLAKRPDGRPKDVDALLEVWDRTIAAAKASGMGEARAKSVVAPARVSAPKTPATPETPIVSARAEKAPLAAGEVVDIVERRSGAKEDASQRSDEDSIATAENPAEESAAVFSDAEVVGAAVPILPVTVLSETITAGLPGVPSEESMNVDASSALEAASGESAQVVGGGESDLASEFSPGLDADANEVAPLPDDPTAVVADDDGLPSANAMADVDGSAEAVADDIGEALPSETSESAAASESINASGLEASSEVPSDPAAAVAATTSFPTLVASVSPNAPVAEAHEGIDPAPGEVSLAPPGELTSFQTLMTPAVADESGATPEAEAFIHASPTDESALDPNADSAAAAIGSTAAEAPREWEAEGAIELLQSTPDTGITSFHTLSRASATSDSAEPIHKGIAPADSAGMADMADAEAAALPADAADSAAGEISEEIADTAPASFDDQVARFPTIAEGVTDGASATETTHTTNAAVVQDGPMEDADAVAAEAREDAPPHGHDGNSPAETAEPPAGAIPDDAALSSPVSKNAIEPVVEALEELFPLDPNEISGCMLPPAPAQLAHNADGDWIAVCTVSGVDDRLRTEMLAMARQCMESPHPRLLNVLAIGDDSIRSQWPCGVSVAMILSVKGGSLPVKCLLSWLPPLAEAVDWACAHGLHKIGMHPSQWLVTFPADVDANPARFAARKCEEWGEYSVLLDPLAGFARDVAGAGANSPGATDPGSGAESLATPTQWLAAFARAIYEIAGGTMNGKFAPLALFGEERNLLLTHALGGRSSFESGSAWAAAFVAASKVRPPEPKPSEVRTAPHVTALPALPLPPPAPPLPPIIDPPPPKAGGNAGRRFVAALLILAVVVGSILWGKSMSAGNGDESFRKVSPAPIKVPSVPPTALPVVTAVPTVRPTPTATVVVATPVPTPRPAARSVLDEGQIGGIVDLKLSGGQVIRLCYCPPGTFTMGSPKTEAERMENEGPVEVRISRGFWMAQTEMTQAQWEAVMGPKPNYLEGAKLPVANVSWNEAMACIKKLEGMVKMPAGWKLALPTEAQWEYACRAGTKTVFSFGNQLNGKEANCDGIFPYGTQVTVPNLKTTVYVGKYPANPWGLYDMHGNVYEWCADWFDATLSGGLDPKGPAAGTYRVNRGGSFLDPAVKCRSACRYGFLPDKSDGGLGFRVVAVAAEP